MSAYSRTVYECSPIRRGDPTAVSGEKTMPGHPIPGRVGDPSPIKYVVYIIKENRTYDQVLGDLPEGKGDPNLCLFPEAVTPNHHVLAREAIAALLILRRVSSVSPGRPRATSGIALASRASAIAATASLSRTGRLPRNPAQLRSRPCRATSTHSFEPSTWTIPT